MSVYGFYKTARLVHFLNKDNERDWKNKYTRLRGVAEKLALSSPARQKLERIIFYQTMGKRDKKRKVLIYDIEKKNDFGFLWHIDAIIIWWYGTRRVIFTAIEDITKIAFARIYTTNSSNYSTDFPNWLIEYNNYRPHESLDYLTPLEYAQQNFYKVLPMWSARTKFVI